MPRFVLLRHELPAGHDRASHWDLMLESGAALRTWALPARPDELAQNRGEITAEGLADHRLDYLTYEGPVSGDRGSVTRWDAGEYVLLSETGDRLEVELRGERLAGSLTLLRDPSAAGSHWRVAFSPAAESRGGEAS